MVTIHTETIDILIFGKVGSSKAFLREKCREGDTRALRAVLDAPAQFISTYLTEEGVSHQVLPQLGAVQVEVSEEQLPVLDRLREKNYVNFMARITDPKTGRYQRV